jgi:hypothetical protein
MPFEQRLDAASCPCCAPDGLRQAHYVADTVARYSSLIVANLGRKDFDWADELLARGMTAVVGVWYGHIQAELPYLNLIDPVRNELILASAPGSYFGHACAHEAAVDFALRIHRCIWHEIDFDYAWDIAKAPGVVLTDEILCAYLPGIQADILERPWPKPNALTEACFVEAAKAVARRQELATIQNAIGMQLLAQPVPTPDRNASLPILDGPHDGCWLTWNGKRHDIPKGVVYRLLKFMWARQSADYATLMDCSGGVFDGPVEPQTVRSNVSDANGVLRRIGVDWKLTTDSTAQIVTKCPADAEQSKKGEGKKRLK